MLPVDLTGGGRVRDVVDNVTGFQIWQLGGDLNAADFVPVLPNDEWDNVYIQNGGSVDLIIRTTLQSEKTEVTIPAGEGLAVAVPRGVQGTRFKPGKVAFFAKVASGDGTGAYCLWA